MRILMLAALLSLPVFAQKQSINEDQRSVTWDRHTVKLGQPRTAAMRGLSGSGRMVQISSVGVTILFNARDMVSEIIVRAPFAGKTRKGIGIGSSAQELQRKYMGNRPAKSPVQLDGFLVTVGSKGVDSIRINGRRAQLVGGPPSLVGPGRNPGANRPRPTHPGRPGGAQAGANLQSTTVIWDQTWSATPGKKRWVSAPGNAWPVDRGKLLVRVAYGPGVVNVDQLHAGILRPNTPADDLPTPVDFLVENVRERGGTGLTWQWAATGRGRIRVQIIWFPREKDLKRYVRRNGFAQFQATVARPGGPGVVHPGAGYEAQAQRVTKIWDHTWDTAPTGWTWVKGPRRNWARDGSLLVRALGSHHVQEIAYRVGARGRAHRKPLGDHIIETGVLPEHVSNPLEEVFGGGQRKHLHFGARGRGRVRVQVYWIPHENIGPRWCQEHPLEPIVFPGDPVNPGAGHGHPHGGGNVPVGGAVVVDPRRAPGHVTVTFQGQLVHQGSGVPVSGVDLIVQQQAAPRAIYGGVRTDGNGAFSIDVAVPIGTHVVLRVPAHNQESKGRAFQNERESMTWNPHLR